MNNGYTKLFGSIVLSSLWRSESNETRIVWITMMAIANRDGIVEASVPGLADIAKVSVKETREALRKFMSPDPDSRTPDYDGRRIEAVQGGWRLLNYQKYREKMSREDRREYLRVKQAEYRARQSAKNSPTGIVAPGNGIPETGHEGKTEPKLTAAELIRKKVNEELAAEKAAKLEIMRKRKAALAQSPETEVPDELGECGVRVEPEIPDEAKNIFELPDEEVERIAREGGVL